MKDEKEMFDPKSKRYNSKPVKEDMMVWLIITVASCISVVVMVAYAPTLTIWFKVINPVYKACFAIAISLCSFWLFRRK